MGLRKATEAMCLEKALLQPRTVMDSGGTGFRAEGKTRGNLGHLSKTLVSETGIKHVREDRTDRTRTLYRKDKQNMTEHFFTVKQIYKKKKKKSPVVFTFRTLG